VATSFKKLTANISPERRARIEAKKAEMRQEMALADLRHAVVMSQETMAELMDVAQSEVSKIENRSDMYLSTIRRYVEVLGGRLEVVAKMPSGDVRISKFGTIKRRAEP
jgi:predicted transcriptional regulator